MWQTQDIETLTFVGLALAFSAWEYLRPARQVDHWADLRIDVMSFALAVLMNRASKASVRSILGSASPDFMISWVNWLQSFPSVIKIGLALVMVDFIIYWIHRAQHRLNFMWRTHKWHHSIEHMYWFAGFRTSFLHSFI